MEDMAKKGKGARTKGQAAAFRKVICRNRKARHEYFIVEQLEAGMVLRGSEVKSLRMGRASIQEAYCKILDGEVYLVGATISEYPWSHQFNHEPGRKRKLLLHAREIARLEAAVREKGVTLIPLELYFNERGKAKCLVGLAKGKKKYDRRDAIKRRDMDRDMGRFAR